MTYTLKNASLLVAALLTLASGSVAQDTSAYVVYHGAYYEDAGTNPEDPTFGSINLVLPRENGAFAGEMSFTFVGCQTQSAGQIEGIKTDSSLSGRWSGAVDQTQQAGAFSGAVQADGKITGDYTVDGGKQYNVVGDCIEYFIAPKGTFTLTTAPAFVESAPDTQENDLVTVTCTDQITITPKWPSSVYLVAVQIVVPGDPTPTVVTPVQEIAHLKEVTFDTQDLTDLATQQGLSEWGAAYVMVTAVNARTLARESPIIMNASCMPEFAKLSP